MLQESILLVEDNRDLARSLGEYLLEIGYEVDFAFNGLSAIELLKANSYDVIVLDVMMPGQDGFETCEMARNELYITTPILFLTARDSLEDKIAGFSAGADDYLLKPFSPEELVWRIRAVIRRNEGRHTLAIQKIGDIQIDHRLNMVTRAGRSIDLHDIQYRLLQLLAQAAPEPVSREKLEAELWPEGLPESDPLRTHIYRLRRALDKPFPSAYIKTVHGRGYRLAIPN